MKLDYLHLNRGDSVCIGDCSPFSSNLNLGIHNAGAAVNLVIGEADAATPATETVERVERVSPNALNIYFMNGGRLALRAVGNVLTAIYNEKVDVEVAL
jgi:hypothetical protein